MKRTTSEPPMSDEVAVRRRGLRTGFTTGTCAAAAAKAASLGLVSGVVPDQVEVGLPNGRRVTFAVQVAGAVKEGQRPRAVVVKDAGDDPDCTNGARLTAEVCWAPGASSSQLVAGEGVGTVTMPGLGIDVGAPSITPVPRRMILAAIEEVDGVAGAEVSEGRQALVVTLSVPGGESMAAKTTNQRLGIVGGISILGTSGIVRPFSTAAYRASVVQQIDVAAAQGERAMVLCTGSRSESAALSLFKALPAVCVVEVGDFTGIALRRCVQRQVVRVDIVAMAGKIAKLAAGVMMTHFHRSTVDTTLLADVAEKTGAPAEVVEAATTTATARHFFEACMRTASVEPLQRLCSMAVECCRTHVAGGLEVGVTMVDFDGTTVVARA